MRGSLLVSIGYLIYILLTFVQLTLLKPVFAENPAEKNPYLDRARRETEGFDPSRLSTMKRAEKEAAPFRNPKEINPFFREAQEEARSLVEAFSGGNGTDTAKTVRNNEERKKTLYVLISRSVDKQFIRNVYADSKREGLNLVFVIRGFVDGAVKLRPTLLWWIEVSGNDVFEKRRILPLEINPMLFRNTNPRGVPALYDPENDCLVYGDSSLKGLLEAMRSERCGETLGKVSEITEEDAVSQIQERIREANLNWTKLIEKMKRRFEARYANFSCIELPKAEKDEVYRVTPRYVLDVDIPDPKSGGIIYPRGFSFNPLEFGSPEGSLLLTDLTDPVQRKKLVGLASSLPRPVRILITRGRISDLDGVELPEGVAVFASCSAVKRVVAYGACRALPCAVIFDPPNLVVREFRLVR